MNQPISNLQTPIPQDALFSPERPILTLSEDELGRKEFAEAVAKVIGQWGNRDSLVIAIYGPWGSGKSSLKNMVLDALPKKSAKTITLQFNPWEWSGQEKVFDGFFTELSAKLGSKDASKKAAVAAKKILVYGAMFSAAASIYSGVRLLIVGFLLAISALSLVPLSHNSSLLSVSKILGILAFVAAGILAAFADAGNKLAAYMTAKAEATRKGVDDLRKELQKLLGALDTNVLVVIDDVDRLTPEGIRMVFQLVKANADFPNLVYLLLFQRDTVEKALARMGELDGSQFLEKVVQVGIDIPKLSPSTLEESIESAISRVIQGTPAEKRFDTQRWAKLFVSAVRPYFRTLRDVKRFSNTLSFHFELYVNDNTFDANPVDLICLEVLRQFEAPLYNNLFSLQPLLTGVPRSALGFNFSLEGPNAAEALIKDAGRQQEATQLLSNLFPPFAWALAEAHRKGGGNTPHAASYRQEWLNDLRACHPDVFERYFKFSLSPQDLSEAEMSSLLSVVGNRARLVQKLRELSEKGLLGPAIVRLGAQKPTLDNESLVPFGVGLLDMEKELIARAPTTRVAAVPIDVQAVLLVGSVLRQRPAGERGALLHEIITQTTALFLPMISFESTEEERTRTMDPLVSADEAKDLRAVCVQKVQAASQTTELLFHPRLRYILRNWFKWGSELDVSTWLTKIAKSDSGLPFLLTAFAESMNQIGDQGQTLSVQYRFALEDFSRFLNPNDLAERIRLLSTSGSEHVWVYKLYLRAFDHWKSTGHYASPQDLDEWTALDNL